MKNLALIFLFLFTAVNMQSQTKVGIIDADYILGQLP